MKSYEQYCGLALALDRIGERWTLLIVRELLTGPKRFSDVAKGLPGVATNLLAARLKSLQIGGLIERRSLPAPATVEVYDLTELGRGLTEIVHALVRWGGQFMQERTHGQNFQPHWMAVALQVLLSPRLTVKIPVTVLVEVPEGRIALRVHADGIRTENADTAIPDVHLKGPAPVILGLAAGELDWASARTMGLAISGRSDATRIARGLFMGPQRRTAAK